MPAAPAPSAPKARTRRPAAPGPNLFSRELVQAPPPAPQTAGCPESRCACDGPVVAASGDRACDHCADHCAEQDPNWAERDPAERERAEAWIASLNKPNTAVGALVAETLCRSRVVDMNDTERAAYGSGSVEEHLKELIGECKTFDEIADERGGEAVLKVRFRPLARPPP